MVKMAAKLINCTKEEQRSVIRFLWAEGVPGAQIHLRMCAQYGDEVLSRRIVYEWIEMFENGRTSVTDAERRKVDVDHLLGLSRAYSRNLSGTWNSCHKCNVL